jgi:DNA helicase-2/ATP-dependent DNA helicase PcrA
MDHLLENLNPPQREAVTTTDGPLLIIAGAGSGKTRVITYRVAYLVRELGVHPSHILAVTFTNKAAEEMRERVRRLLEGGRDMPFAISTFHAWCARELRRQAEKIGLARDFTICDDDDQMSAIKEVFRAKDLDIKKGPILPSQARYAIDQAKMKLEGPEDVRAQGLDHMRANLYADVFAAYEQMLRRNNALDFGDLLAEMVKLLERDAEVLAWYQDRYRYLMVDEYQDTNHVQYRLVSALASKNRNLCVVGDEDQSIYSWRGADIGNLLDFQKQFPEAKLIRLEQNYRSTQNILDAADHVICHNRQRLGKTLWTERGAGPPVLSFESPGDREEADHIVGLIDWLHVQCRIPHNEIGVFFRTNALSRIIEEKLRGANIPYRLIGGVGFYERKEIKDLLAYLRVIANPFDSMALTRIINTPRRGIGDKTFEMVVGRSIRENRPVFATIDLLRQEGAFAKAAERNITAFVDLMNGWIARARTMAVGGILDMVLRETAYIDSLGDPASLEVISRRENIDELRNAVAQFEKDRLEATLTDFLEYTTLRSSVDEYESEDAAVSLMTIHCAKGLEFRAVFIMALERDIFPHFLSVKEKGEEEERRLFYVGVTRAKEILCLSWAAMRYAHGEPRWNQPSAFLREVPRELVSRPTPSVLGDIRARIARGGDGVDEVDVVDAVDSVDAEGRQRSLRRTKPSRKKASAVPHDIAASVKPNVKWTVGQSLVHPELGRGAIIAVNGEGRAETLVVQFEEGRTMEFLSAYARLKREERP